VAVTASLAADHHLQEPSEAIMFARRASREKEVRGIGCLSWQMHEMVAASGDASEKSL